jgi:hypothetical protein
MEKKGESDIPISKEEKRDDKEIYGKMAKRIIRVARAMRVPDSELENMVQEVLTAHFQKEQMKAMCGVPSGFDPTKLPETTPWDDALASYLVGILRHKVADHFEKVGRYPSESIDGGKGGGGNDETPFRVMELVSAAPLPEGKVIAIDLQQKLIGLMQNDEIAVRFIRCSLDISGAEGKVDQQLAELIFGDVKKTREVVNTRKRILRRIHTEVEREQRKNGANQSWLTQMMTMASPATETPVRTPGPTPQCVTTPNASV